MFDFKNVFLFWSILALVAVIFVCFLRETPIDHSKYEIKS
jgi:hypothetical protein